MISRPLTRFLWLVPLLVWSQSTATASQGALPLFGVPDHPAVIATGGASGPLARGSRAIFSNPAGLAGSPGAFQLSHGWLYQNLRRSSGAFFLPIGSPALLKDRLCLGMGITSIGYPDMERRTGPSSLPEGEYGAHDTRVGVSMAFDAGRGFRIGTTGSVVDTRISGDGASGWSLDFGIQQSITSLGLELGAAALNVGRMGAVVSETSHLWATYQIGMRWTSPVQGLSASGALRRDDDGDLTELFGMEYTISERYALRGGKVFNHDTAGFAAGCGIVLGDLGLDYSWEEYGLDLGPAHRMALSWRL